MPPLKVEYAKSARSRCANKQCAEIIEKGELRIGTGNMMPGMDDYSYKWRHLCCFTKRQLTSLSTIDQLDGYDDVKDGEQQLLVKLVNGELIDKVELKGATGDCTIGTKRPHDVAEEEDTAPLAKKPKPAPKKKKDPNSPKKPKNAFMFFLQEQQPIMRGEKPDVPLKDIKKEIANVWADLEDDKGKPYRERARADKKRYDEETKKHEEMKKDEEDGADCVVVSPPVPVPVPVPTPSPIAKKQHFVDEESDISEEVDSEKCVPVSAKPACKYGDACYRENPAHLAQFSHPRDLDVAEVKPKMKAKPVEEPSPSPPPPVKKQPAPTTATATAANTTNLPVCPYGALCCRTANDHVNKFYHPTEDLDDEEE
eukprot:TRINITY_DN4267_c0_g1_i2.p1 TRINITY_DN4267_c0_g1~~TRINITY_DN4267_c0_g1_i2.p1  ORF type:complete len:369 (+),score=81.56 TRINITY_DN4267_c0_g1_i2:55-1161(+)